MRDFLASPSEVSENNLYSDMLDFIPIDQSGHFGINVVDPFVSGQLSAVQTFFPGSTGVPFMSQ
jgi:hypothetical protein